MRWSKFIGIIGRNDALKSLITVVYTFFCNNEVVYCNDEVHFTSEE